MKRQSKFDAIFDRKRSPKEEEEEEEPAPKISSPRKESPKKRGRPAGKRTDPEYAQVTAYIPRALHDEVKILLIREGNKEFSALVEELLVEWKQTKSGTPKRGRCSGPQS